jgi:hypothetical protein
MLKVVFAKPIIQLQQIIRISLPVEHRFPGAEGLPDTGSFAFSAGQVESDFMDFFLFCRVFHYDDIFPKTPHKVAQIVAQII